MAKTLISFFPKEGDTFCEPFIGRGNVTWPALRDMQHGKLRYKNLWFNDLDMSFFRALETHGHLVTIPARLTRKEQKAQREAAYDERKADSKKGCPYATLLQPYLCFKGGGYENGGPESNRKAVSQAGYRLNLTLAQELWLWAKPIMRTDESCWTKLDWAQLGWNDFVYFGVPYSDTDTRHYDTSTMDYAKLREVLRDAPFKWLLEEYPQPEYMDVLGDPVYIASLQCAASGKKNDRRIEYIWTNYDAAGNRVELPRRNANVYAEFSIREQQRVSKAIQKNRRTHGKELDTTRDSDHSRDILQYVEGRGAGQDNQPSGSLQQAGDTSVATHTEINRIPLPQHRSDIEFGKPERFGFGSDGKYITFTSGNGAGEHAGIEARPSIGEVFKHPMYGNSTVVFSDEEYTVLRFGREKRKFKTNLLLSISKSEIPDDSLSRR